MATSKLRVQRKTLAGNKTEFKFDAPARVFLVKNLSNADCYVAFDSEATDDESIKIPSKTAQKCATEFYEVGALSTDTIYVTGTGEVEVQEIWL